MTTAAKPPKEVGIEFMEVHMPQDLGKVEHEMVQVHYKMERVVKSNQLLTKASKPQKGQEKRSAPREQLPRWTSQWGILLLTRWIQNRKRSGLLPANNYQGVQVSKVCCS